MYNSHSTFACSIVTVLCALYTVLSVLFMQATQQIIQLYKLFIGVDATQVEINPLGETPQGKGLCVTD